MTNKTLLLLTLLLFHRVTSAQVFPVQVATQITPPYSPYLSDYTAPGAQRFMIHIRTNDVAITDYNCRLRITIEGAGITLRTKENYATGPIVLHGGGLPQVLYGEDIPEYFHPDALDFSGLSRSVYEKNGRLPEGVYRFSVEVLDYNRGTTVSNRATTTAWVVLNDPPMLNLPTNFAKIAIADPTNILFTWTPRHSGSPNAAFTTEYVFRLMELWPENRNPYDAFLTQPPLYEASTTETHYLYSNTEPALLPGRKYAWQIQARDVGGRDLFKNNGRSEVFVFQYGEALAIPANLRMRWAKPTTLAIQWDAISNPAPETRYRLLYRPRRRSDNHQWYETWTRFKEKTLYDLREHTEYEMKIRAENQQQESDYSAIRIFKTLRADEVEFICSADVEPPPLPDNTLPEFPVSINDTIHAGGYEVLVRDVMKVGSRYHGSGLAIVPWFNDAKVRVTFEKIAVNDQFHLTSGTIHTLWNPESTSLIREETPISGGNAPQAGEVDITVVAADSVITLQDAAIASVTIAASGDIIVITTDGKQQVLPKEQSYAIVDQTGNGYVIDERGNIAKTTGTEANAAGARGRRTYDLALKFAKGGGRYGFDEKQYEALSRYYQQLDDGTYAGWKALSSTAPDIIEGTFADTDADVSRVTFEVGGAVVPAVATQDRTLTLTLQGKAAGMEEELLALVQTADTVPPKVLGKINVVTYDPIHYNLVLVPVNDVAMPGGTDAHSVSTHLNAVYEQAVVSWHVTVTGALQVPLTDTFDEGGGGLFSNYTADMKKVLDAYGTFNPNTYYLFIIDESRNASALGYMPRGRQAGFVFAASHKGDAREFLKTIAHELGHGAFHLKHTFSEFALPSGVTDNVMDYSNGTALYKYQWDYIHEPQRVMGWFEGGDDGASVLTARMAFFDIAAPLLQEAQFQAWVEKFRRVSDFLQACADEGWESYRGRGIIPYCFWRDVDVNSFLHYTNADPAFTAGLIDGAYVELEGFYQLPGVVRNVGKLPGKVLYAYTLAYWECRTDKLLASLEDYEYVVDELAKAEAEGGLWNWVKEQWYEYKGQREELEEYLSDCRDAEDLRETIEDLYELSENWEEIKSLSEAVYKSVQVYLDTLNSKDNHGRYERGALIVPAATLFLPLGAGIASKAEKVKAVLKVLRDASKEDLRKVAGRMAGSLGSESAKRVDEPAIVRLLNDDELSLLSKSIKYVPGPDLPPRIAATFSNSAYTNRKLLNSERFYKYHGSENRTGKKYTWVVKNKYVTEKELRARLAIRVDWEVDIKYVSEFEAPKGTWVSEGRAAPQGAGYPGGHYQAVILNVPRSWIIKTTEAF